MRNKGFTLIELLVVVLIVGVLSTIAVPKYTRAMQKAKALNTLMLVRSVYDAENRYYMTNGKYANKFSDLDINLEGTTKPTSALLGQNATTSTDGVRRYGNYSEIILTESGTGQANSSYYFAVTSSIISGPYIGAEFFYFLNNTNTNAKNVPLATAACSEHYNYFKSKNRDGDFCVKVMGYSFQTDAAGWNRKYYIQK